MNLRCWPCRPRAEANDGGGEEAASRHLEVGHVAPKDNKPPGSASSCSGVITTTLPAALARQLVPITGLFHVGAAKIGGGGRRRPDDAEESRTTVERVRLRYRGFSFRRS